MSEEEIDPLDHDHMCWTIADQTKRVYEMSPQYLLVANWDVMTVQWRATHGQVLISGSVQNDGVAPSRCLYDELDVFANINKHVEIQMMTHGIRQPHFLVRNLDIRDLSYVRFKFVGAEYHTLVVWLGKDEKSKYEARWHRELEAREAVERRLAARECEFERIRVNDAFGGKAGE